MELTTFMGAAIVSFLGPAAREHDISGLAYGIDHLGLRIEREDLVNDRYRRAYHGCRLDGPWPGEESLHEYRCDRSAVFEG